MQAAFHAPTHLPCCLRSPSTISSIDVKVKRPRSNPSRRLRVRTQVHASSARIGTGVDANTPIASMKTSTIGEFRTWALENGFEIPCVEVSVFSGGLRGLRSTCAIKRGDEILTAPPSYVLQTTTLEGARSPLPDIPNSTWRKLPWDARLALKLHSIRNDPRWRPWIEILPKQVDKPIQWSDDEIGELQCPHMKKVIETRRRKYKKIYEMISSDAPMQTMSYEEFEWCLSCVQSRAFEGPLETTPWRERVRLMAFVGVNTFAWPLVGMLDWNAALNGGLTALLALVAYDLLQPRILRAVRGVQLRRYALAPGIDLFNHDAPQKSDPDSAPADVAYEYFADKFVVRATRNHQQGEQVFISYGPRNNDRLLLYYGFILDDNPHDEYVFGEEAEKLLSVPSDSLRLDADGKFSQSALKTLSNSLKGGKNEIAQVLHELCVAELDSLPTTIEDDQKLLNSDVLSETARTAVRYRIGKKKILRAATLL